MRILSLLAGFALLAGCTGGGPRANDIINGENATRLETESAERYVLVELNQSMAGKVDAAESASHKSSFFPQSRSGPVVIGSGDILNIAIVSTSEGGFIDFSQSAVSPVSATPLPPQEVGSDGNVNVPPVGRVLARGKTVQQFETFLSRKLGEVLVEPSVIVSLAERRSARVAVLGSVEVPGTYSIGLDNSHLIDVIAGAGGPQGRAAELLVNMSRGGRTASVPLDQLYAQPRYNVHVKARDVVSLEPFLTRVSILGGTTANTTLEFDEPVVTLADTLARAGGILNRRADRKGIFIYRNMRKSAVSKLGADLSEFSGDEIPTIFQLDLREPTSLFAASRFKMQSGDVIYVADSLNEEINAAFGTITTFVPTPAEYVRAETVPLQQ